MLKLETMRISRMIPSRSFLSGLCLAISVLVFCTGGNFLLFHTVAEVATVSMAFALFLLVWNAREYLHDNFLLIIGIGYGFCALLDLLHTLAFKGMNIFPPDNGNLGIQLWTVARWIQAATLLAATSGRLRTVSPRAVFAGFAAGAALLLAAIFSGMFPHCFRNGTGLTGFKMANEALIVVCHGISLGLMFRNRSRFDERIFALVAGSIVLVMVSGLTFTAYLSNLYGPIMTAGHVLKIASFGFIYQAILVAGIREPFALIFREQKLSQELSQTVNANLSATLRAIPDLLFEFDSAGTYLNIWTQNPDVLVAREAALLGHTVSEMLPPAAAAVVMAAIREAEENGASYGHTIELELQGEQHWFELSTARKDETPEEGKRFIMLSRNISGRKRAEKLLRELNYTLEKRVGERTVELEAANSRLQELDRMKNIFIASMSHELRTPLNSAIGFSRILHEEWAGPLNSEQKEHLATVLKSCNQLLALINDVIDVTRIEAGKIDTQVTEFDVREVIDEAVESCEKAVADKRIELRIVADRHTICSDRTRLLQCLLNLVSNAVKYTEQGAITIGAKVTDDGASLELSVADSGIGIAEGELGKLFSPFVRLDSHLTTTVPGTGLGLYLTRRLAQEVLAGTITVRSKPDAGSVFVLKVPVRLPQPESSP